MPLKKSYLIISIIKSLPLSYLLIIDDKMHWYFFVKIYRFYSDDNKCINKIFVRLTKVTDRT